MRMRNLGLLGFVLAVCMPFTGCVIRVDAIEVSQEQLNFGTLTAPLNIQVWNINDRFEQLAIDVETSAAWIVPDKIALSSAAPEGDAYDRQLVKITINRRLLSKGSHKGWVEFSSPRAFPVRVEVLVEQAEDGAGVLDKLNIVNLTYNYSSPYLLDFSFSLRDEDDNPVVAEPGQFEILAQENASTVEEYETGVHLKKSVARQLKIDLALDYSASMQDAVSPGAIAAMEDAVIDVLLPALNADAQVGVVEFHVESSAPRRVSALTANHDYVADRILTIQEEYVGGFYGGSRAFDAVVMSADNFPPGDPLKEDRYIVLLSDGKDTSSSVNADEAIDAALEADAHIYAIGFGADVNEEDLEYMASETGGEYFAAGSVADFGETFQRIVNELGGQYTLRWATLRRSGNTFKPSFLISLDDVSASFASSKTFNPRDYDGDELLGALRLVESGDLVNDTAFLRADYVPRFIRGVVLYVKSALDFDVALVDAGDDGLLAGWDIAVEDAGGGGKWITVETPDAPIPFATFGPMLRFVFDGVPAEGAALVDEIYVDNSIYANGQAFEVQGFDNTPPE